MDIGIVAIIEWLRRREEEKQESERPFLELPLEEPIFNEVEENEESDERGIIVIDLV